MAAADVVLCADAAGIPGRNISKKAVRQGKHAFIEKPVATDANGVRRVLAAGEEAKKKNLNVCVGLQRPLPAELHRDHQSAFKMARSAT